MAIQYTYEYDTKPQDEAGKAFVEGGLDAYFAALAAASPPPAPAPTPEPPPPPPPQEPIYVDPGPVYEEPPPSPQLIYNGLTGSYYAPGDPYTPRNSDGSVKITSSPAGGLSVVTPPASPVVAAQTPTGVLPTQQQQPSGALASIPGLSDKEVKEAKDFWTKATGKPIGMTDKEIEQFIKDNPEDFNLKLLAVADRLQSAPTPATSGAGTTTGVTGADTITGAAGNDAVKPTTPPPTSSLLSGVDKYINPISGKDETQLLKQLLDKQLKEQGITNLDQLSLENISEGFEDFVNSPQTRTALINKTTGAEVNPVLFDDGYGTKFVVTPNGIEKQFVAAEKVAKQAASILDPNSTGGAWTTQAGKSSGPGFGTQGMLNQIGQRIVEITGITDLSQLGARQVPVEGYYRTVSGGEGGDVSEYVPASTKTEFFDKETGQTIDWDGSLGTWGQGPGTTYGNVTADAEGKLKVQTLGDDSTDPFIKAVAKAGPVLNIANVLTGGALTPLTLAVNSINAIANENPFAIAASFAGLGGYTGLIDTATASAIQVGANAANAVKEGNLLGALATIAGSSVGQGIGTVELGNGITVTDALNAASAVDKAVKGDIAGALADAGKAANSTELKTAGAALQLVNALESGNLNAIANAAQGLYSGVNNLVTQSQVGQLLVDSAGIGAIDADLGGDLLGTGALSTLKTDTVTGGLSGAADTAGGGSAVDNVVRSGLPGGADTVGSAATKDTIQDLIEPPSVE
ncbi:hypothetical protein EB077_07355, partial [bacterium]|nr:hypothetical protein [bacterium]